MNIIVLANALVSAFELISPTIMGSYCLTWLFAVKTS